MANTRLKLISDHTDERDNLPKDRLGREDMVNAIAEAITQVDPPFTFGIYGSWGSGKTHFMKSVEERLNTSKLDEAWNPKVVTVMFEAWRHQRDEHPEISMIGCLREDLQHRNSSDYQTKQLPETLKKWLERKFPVKRTHRKLKKLGKALIRLIPALEVGVEVGIPGVGKVRVNGKSSPKRVEEHVRLKETFDKLFDRVLGKKGIAPNANRVVFFIDDLDRCLDSTIIKMLEQIKLFFWNKHCVFVLGADHKVIEGIVDKGKYAEGRRYLEKIVNFPFYLPSLGNEVTSGFFIDKITDKTDEKDLDNDENALIKLFNRASIDSKVNPRRMILLANAYKFNNYLTREAISRQGNGTTKYHEQITAVFTVLQTLHEEAFNILCENRSGSEEGENLKAFFTKPTGEPPDPFDQLFSPKGSEPNAAAPNEIAGIDLEAINEIRKWAWEHCSEIIKKLTGKNLLVYVRFLVSQSEAKKLSKSDSRVWYKGDSWAWYWKNPSVSEDAIIAPVQSNSKELLDWINPIINNAESSAKPLVIDGYTWRVIDVNSNDDGNAKEVLLLSEDIIGRGRMDNTPQDWNSYEYKWSESALCGKLNSDAWLKEHLPVLHRSGMIQENHPAEDGEDSGALGKVFLLSTDEVKTLLTEDLAGLQKATTPQGQAGWWWLRSPCFNYSSSAAGVLSDGHVSGSGSYVYGDGGGVRPALWLNL